MNVFVTGASGFIGSYVCRELVASGHVVAGLSREDKPWRLADVEGRMRLLRGGLEDQEVWSERLRDFSPDAVAHLGWLGVGNFDRNSLAQTKNIGWSLDLLERSAKYGARVFVGVGSQAEYGVTPEQPEQPTTLYGEAKLATGRLCAMAARQVGVRFSWMRVFSTFGPTDNPYWMLPSLINDLARGKRPALTKGEQKWDFLHVADAARAVRFAIENDAASGVYPLGSGEAPPLRTTIEMVRDEIDPHLPLGFGEVPYRPDQVMQLKADVSRLRDELGWQPTIKLADGIAATVAWYKCNRWIFE